MYEKTLKEYQPNPEAKTTKTGNITDCTQDLLKGGQYSTAWQVNDSNKTQTLIFSVCKTYPLNTARAEAINLVKKVSSCDLKNWISSHKKWWNNYYPLSFVSIPDSRLESFYWIQMYKMDSSPRDDRPMMDTAGPWIQPTPWPYITWDLNVQLCYWPTCDSNRLTLAKSLPQTLNKNMQNLIENVRPTAWQTDSAYVSVTSTQDLISRRDGDKRYYNCIGNLPWAMHNCWMMYRRTMDDQMLQTEVYPLLRRAINLYFHMSFEDENGKIHLKPSYSPEYHRQNQEDTNYDLALFKWGCQTLLWIVDRLELTDPLEPKWRHLVENITDYPIDKNGLMLGKNTPIARSHRHYSHMLNIYPLYELNIENGNRELIQKTLDHWISFKGALQGYSYTGASSFSAALGDGDKSLEYLNGLTRFLTPNAL